MSIQVTGYHHIRLTVRDLARSRAFYDAVFALPVVAEVPQDADEATRERLAFLFGGVVYRLGDGLFGLRPVADPEDRFHEDRVGLDHVSFRVTSVQDLDDAVAVLHELGVDHAGVKDIGSGSILEFRDPDGIALELFAPNR
jgi:glyoxylase I family protein